jgi:hypothetical protein
VKTEPLSPMTDEHDFAYASDFTKDTGLDQDMLLNFHSRNYVFLDAIVITFYRNLYATKAIRTFSLEKTSPSPTLPFCMKISKKNNEIKVSFQCCDHLNFMRIVLEF